MGSTASWVLGRCNQHTRGQDSGPRQAQDNALDVQTAPKMLSGRRATLLTLLPRGGQSTCQAGGTKTTPAVSSAQVSVAWKMSA